MISYYIFSVLLVIIISAVVAGVIKHELNRIRSKYLYWNEDELKMETWDEHKKRIELLWAAKQLKDILAKQYKKEHGDLN